MKDGLKRTIAAVIGVAGIAYIAWMLAQHQTFVVDNLIANQMRVGIGFIVLFFLFVLWLAIRPLAIKRLKWWIVAYSIVLIFLAQFTLINRADLGIYAGDVVKFIAVIIFFLAVSGALVTKKAKQQIEKAMQEIIEV